MLFLMLGKAGADVEAELEAERKSQTGDAITIIFDDSGSMRADHKMEQAKEAFFQWLSGPAAGTYSLIHFAKGGRILVPFERGTREAMREAVIKLSPRYNTPIARCLAIAHREIKKRREVVSPYERHIILVFTDGQETRSPRGNAAVAEAIAGITGDGHGTEVVGIGFQGEGTYMAQDATAFYLANNAQELLASLKQVAAEVDAQAEFELTQEEAEKMATMDFRSAARTEEAGSLIKQVADAEQELYGARTRQKASETGRGGWLIFSLIALIVVVGRVLSAALK